MPHTHKAHPPKFNSRLCGSENGINETNSFLKHTRDNDNTSIYK